MSSKSPENFQPPSGYFDSNNRSFIKIGTVLITAPIPSYDKSEIDTFSYHGLAFIAKHYEEHIKVLQKKIDEAERKLKEIQLRMI